MNLTLTGQNLEKADIAPKLLKLKNLMEERKVVWIRLPKDKKIAWAKSTKDPVMALAVDVFKYLNSNFYEPLQNDL